MLAACRNSCRQVLVGLAINHSARSAIISSKDVASAPPEINCLEFQTAAEGDVTMLGSERIAETDGHARRT